jgi:hypothetical protein
VFRITRKKLLAVVVATSILIVSGVAYAAWTSNGVGSGRAASGTAVS